MTKKRLQISLLALCLISAITFTGCGVQGFGLGLLGVPIPVTPVLQNHYEDAAWEKERYEDVAILAPIVAGEMPAALDEPSDDQVMRLLEKVRPINKGIPLFHSVHRDNVRIQKIQTLDTVDAPRHYPLIGPAQLHHSHWKCIVTFKETTRVGWPIPYTTVDEDAREVLYIDKDHLHHYGNVDMGPGANR